MSAHPELSLADVCFSSANTGRSPFDHRLAIVADSLEQLGDRLHLFATAAWSGHHSRQNQSPSAKKSLSGSPARKIPESALAIISIAPSPLSARPLAHCERILLPYLEKPLLSLLYPEDDREAPIPSLVIPRPQFRPRIRPRRSLEILGIVAEASLGYGIGEAIAACLTGTVSLETILPAIATGEYQETPGRDGRKNWPNSPGQNAISIWKSVGTGNFPQLTQNFPELGFPVGKTLARNGNPCFSV